MNTATNLSPRNSAKMPVWVLPLVVLMGLAGVYFLTAAFGVLIGVLITFLLLERL